MARPSECNAEFRSDVVVLWRAAACRRTFKDVAADLNVNPETLGMWVRVAEGRTVPGRVPEVQDVRAELARLRAELARLRAELARLLKAEKEWHLEREIPRWAVACFAREMK